jgi:hypothetical protein
MKGEGEKRKAEGGKLKAEGGKLKAERKPHFQKAALVAEGVKRKAEMT